MHAALLMLADSRLPAGGHAHSGGLAQAVQHERVRDLDGLAAFLRGRLSTTGRTSAAVAARAATLVAAGDVPGLADLDHAVDARTPSAALRLVSRAQGRALLRVASRMWPDPVLALLPDRPHLPVAQGAAVVAAGGGPRDAATLAALHCVSGVASAGVRLLGLDPLAVAGLQARLAPDVDAVAASVGTACTSAPSGADLPASSGPLLDLLAQAHSRMEVRLFAS
jgi:urease accessory protein